MLARALPSILPPMTIAESLDVTKIYSVRGLLPPETPLLRGFQHSAECPSRPEPTAMQSDSTTDPGLNIPRIFPSQ
jgi:predicted ATPase with chaperone activity